MSSSQLTGTAVLDRLRELEARKQAIEVEQLSLIAQVETERLAYDLGAKSTVVLLRDALRIGANDAAGRVRLALAITPPRLITGELVEPQHPQTAQALADRLDLGPGRGHGREDDGQDRRPARRPVSAAV